MANLSPQDILIRMWKTPNPYALKFTFNIPLKTIGNASFYSPEECKELPLVESLFSILGVKQVYLFQNQMTLTHDGKLSEEEIEKQVSSIVRTRIGVHNPQFEIQTTQKKKAPVSDDPQIAKIEEILNRTIRPGLQADGGDLEVISYEGNEIQIAYQGACGGCPSAITGTLEAIENILRHELNKPKLTVTPI